MDLTGRSNPRLVGLTGRIWRTGRRRRAGIGGAPGGGVRPSGLEAATVPGASVATEPSTTSLWDATPADGTSVRTPISPTGSPAASAMSRGLSLSALLHATTRPRAANPTAILMCAFIPNAFRQADKREGEDWLRRNWELNAGRGSVFRPSNPGMKQFGSLAGIHRRRFRRRRTRRRSVGVGTACL